MSKNTTHTKFWTEDITQLFCSTKIVPNENESLEEQMNALSRLILVFFVLLFMINWKYDIIFLFLSLIFIIILYYIKKGMNQNKENYTNMKLSNLPNSLTKKDIIENYGPTYSGVGPLQIKQKPENCNKNLEKNKVYTSNTTNNVNCDQNTIDPVQALTYAKNTKPTFTDSDFNNPNYVSPNQLLVGKPMPRTEVAPVIVPPSKCLDFWKPNDFVVQSGINNESTVDISRSGYLVTDKSYLSNYKCGQNTKYTIPNNCENNSEIFISEVGTSIEPFDDFVPKSQQGGFHHDFEMPSQKINNLKIINNNMDGNIMTEMGYYPNQPFENHLPSNLAVGPAQLDPAFNNYNKNVFTNIIQPGVYTQSDTIQPISDNIGISFTQQFQPVEETNNQNGTTFVYEDPITYVPKNKPYKETINTSNVYDPRFTGSGTSYRTYIDKMTGQPRFYYDDVNCHRKPNYVTRNNIDFTEYGTTYGPQNHKEFMDQRNVRAKAQDTYLNNQLTFRTEMQERLMRKRNAEAWQQKVAPIIKSSFTRRGGN
jgi:hypothetical protein